MQFSRIRLENWRNFSKIDVKLQTRAFIVGANASGKSNLLDAFRFLRDLALPGGGLQKAASDRRGVSIMRNLAARGKNTKIVLDVELSDDGEGEDAWRYRIAFNQDNNQRPLLHEEGVWKAGELVLKRPNAEDVKDNERLTQTYLEQTFANHDFRVISDFFRSIQYSHLVPHLVRDPERSVGRRADPYGGDFLEQLALGKNQPRLRRIQEALKIAVPQLTELEVHRDNTGTPHLRGKYRHWRPNGAWQNELEFSDGTLRLIGLLWALQTGDGPLLLEEPELSLHSGVVRYIPVMMHNIQRQRRKGARQIFVSTHSADLLSDESIQAEEVFLLKASEEGTIMQIAAEIDEIRRELDAGFTVAEAVLPRTIPPELVQMNLALLD